MITLKTLPEATAQEVFDQVAEHLLTQNKKSFTMNSCRYKNSKGLKCAAGCLIGEDEYTEGIEWHLWSDLIITKDFPEKHSKLISSLQLIHDKYAVSEWKKALLSFCISNKLLPTVLNKYG